MSYELISSIIGTFILCMAFWWIIRIIFLTRKYFITKPKGQYFRSRRELLYVVKRELRDFRRYFAVLIISVFVIIISIIPQFSDLIQSNWNEYLLFIASAVAASIAIIVYDRTKVSSEEHDVRIRRIEGIVNSKFEHSIKGKENSIFQVTFALEGILFNIEDLNDEIKEWSQEYNKKRKNNIKKRCQYSWESICEYSKILENSKIVSDKVFKDDILEMIKEIVTQSKKNLDFNDSQNQCKHEGFHAILLNSLLILEKFDVLTQYRYLL